MKLRITIIFCLLLYSGGLYATDKRKDKGPPKTEAELVDAILDCVKYNDTVTYKSLFADFDTIWKNVMRYRDTDAEAMQQVGHLMQNQERIMKFDPYFNQQIVNNFYYVMRKEDDSDVHFKDLILLRYELKKEILTRDLVGYQYIVPLRYHGFIFVKDALTRFIYCIAVSEMQQMNGRWYGGQVINMLQASTIDEYTQKAAAEKKIVERMQALGIPLLPPQDTTTQQHSIKVEEDDDKEKKKVPLEIVDRRFYEGKFDNEITVRLYIQYFKGSCPEKVCSYEAIYKVGEQALYTRLLVTRSEDSSWQFEEEPPVSSMDLKLQGKIFTGTWINGDDQTGYDVYMTQKDIPPVRVHYLDDIIENKLWAKPGEDKEKPREMDIKENNDEGY